MRDTVYCQVLPGADLGWRRVVQAGFQVAEGMFSGTFCEREQTHRPKSVPPVHRIYRGTPLADCATGIHPHRAVDRADRRFPRNHRRQVEAGRLDAESLDPDVGLDRSDGAQLLRPSGLEIPLEPRSRYFGIHIVDLAMLHSRGTQAAPLVPNTSENRAPERLRRESAALCVDSHPPPPATSVIGAVLRSCTTRPPTIVIRTAKD